MRHLFIPILLSPLPLASIFSFDGSFLDVVKWLFIIGIAIFMLRVFLEFTCSVLGIGIGIWGITLFVCFLLKLTGIIGSDTMWTAAEWAFKIGCGIGVIFSIFNFGEILNSAASSSGQSGTSKSKESDKDSWESTHGTIYDHPNGMRYIVDGNGNQFYIYSGTDTHVWDQNGDHWEIYGISAIKRNY